MTRVAYIYSELPSYIRVKKNLKIFSEICDEVVFIGANRSGKSYIFDRAECNVKYEIYDKKISHGGFLSIYQSLGFAFFVLNYLKRNKFDVLVFANEELLWVSKFISYKPTIICEILDSLAIRTIGLVSLLNPFFKLYCNYFYRQCDHLIEVSQHRLDFRRYQHKSVFVIPNCPESHPVVSFDSPDLKNLKYIYVSGSVIPNCSGIETLIKAFENNYFSGLKIVYSGRLNGKWAEECFFSKEFVINLGSLTPAQSLTVARSSIAMFAYYKPINLNYILASPNKVADALMLSKPVLMNNECQAKSILQESGLFLGGAYNDVEILSMNLMKLLDGKFIVSESLCHTLYKKYYSENSIYSNWIKVIKAHV